MLSVIIPTLNEEKRIQEIVAYCLNSKLVHEVIVIDDGSSDRTFELAKKSGAKVFFSSMLGKGTSMLDGLWKAQCDYVLYLDGDIYGFDRNIIEKMIEPLIQKRCDFVKGKFHRQAGRVTALTAKPLLKAFFPNLSEIAQPLGGIIAAKKELLKNLKFEADYGVDIGLLIDASQLGAKILEVDIGSLEHDHQDLVQLGHMSLQIVRVILERASLYKKLDYHYLKDSYELQRVNQLQITPIISKINPKKKLALFDMDGTLIEGRFIERLSLYTNRFDGISNYLDNKNIDAIQRTKMIAKALTGIPKRTFEKIAMTIPLMAEAQKTIVELKKRDFTVGIITDSYFVASEIIRKRVFADFSIAHLLEFKKGKFTGNIEISPFMIAQKCKEHQFCKSNFLSHLEHYYDIDRSLIHFTGDGPNDVCLMKSLKNAVAFKPRSNLVERAASSTCYELNHLLQKWQ